METHDHTVPCFIPQSVISLKIPRYLKSSNFSPNVAEIPNLGTNSPKVGSLVNCYELSVRRHKRVVLRHTLEM